jgi:hypothetical protein
MARPRIPRITPGNAKRAIGVAKIVVPIMAPFAIKAAAYARHRWDVARARRLGVGLERLPDVSGRGAALHARLVRFTAALRDLTQRRLDADTATFVSNTETRLGDLSAAMHAAELMPGQRRRAAHRAVAAELDVLEAELLRRLGVTPTGRAG